MILRSFFASKVHGNLSFGFDVNKDVSFLVGSNGTGKTTALNLINSLLAPDLEELMILSFDEAILVIEHEGEVVTISAQVVNDMVNLTISDVIEPLSFPSYADFDQRFISTDNEIRKSMVSDIIKEYSKSDVVERLAKIPTPIFLGIDRRTAYNPVSMNYYLERDKWNKKNDNTRTARANRLINNSPGINLIETEWLIQDTYERLKKVEDRLSKSLRDNILISAFTYTDFSISEIKGENSFWKEKEGFLKRRGEVKEALLNIGVSDYKLHKEVDIFFEKIEALLIASSISEPEHDGWNVELLANKAQIERIVSIVNAIDKYKFSLDSLFKQINAFLKAVNYFFKDSGKKVSLDAVGKIIIEHDSGSECLLDRLSSGEKQILVIFSHAFFSRYKQEKETVFIIDEPEMSLHLRWQERFAEVILNSIPNSQFLLATHSPEIISGNKNKAITCR